MVGCKDPVDAIVGEDWTGGCARFSARERIIVVRHDSSEPRIVDVNSKSTTIPSGKESGSAGNRTPATVGKRHGGMLESRKARGIEGVT